MALNVLVVGAGPTGLMTAVELARLGHNPTVIEKRDGPSTLSRAVGLQQHSIELMRPCGVADAILAEAIPFSALKVHDGAKRVASIPLNFDDPSRVYGLPQDRTEAHLAEALTRYGHTVHYGAPLEGFEDHGDGVTAQYAGGAHTFDYLIGADGKTSLVREFAGLRYDGYDLPETWSIADVISPDWPDPTSFNVYLLRNGDLAVVVPLEAHRFRVISSTPDAVKTLPVPITVTETRRSGTFNIAIRQAPHYSKGRVHLAGDAAHCHSPVGGRGMNLGLADAAELAERMATDTLDGYSSSRRKAGRHVIQFSENGRKRASSTVPLTRSISFTMFWIAGVVPPLGRALARRFISG